MNFKRQIIFRFIIFKSTTTYQTLNHLLLKKIFSFFLRPQVAILTLLLVTGVTKKAHAWRLFGEEQNYNDAVYTVGPGQNKCYWVIPTTTYFFGFTTGHSTIWQETDCVHPGIDATPQEGF